MVIKELLSYKKVHWGGDMTNISSWDDFDHEDDIDFILDEHHHVDMQGAHQAW